ncbi:unnamed protein product, partial [Discosporangium mesarthrocarpum]
MENGTGTRPDFVLNVEGMMCQTNCGSKVRKAIEAIHGVSKADVSFDEKKAWVWGPLSVRESVVAAVECVGFMVTTTVETVLEVEGMMCQKNCGTTVGNVLKAVPGVEKVHVSFAERQARVWGEGVLAADLIDAVESVGFGARVAPDAVLSVDGMMCQRNCGMTVKNALEGVSGVALAEVSFKDGLARVWRGAGLPVSDLVDAVEAVGFGAASLAPPGGDNPPPAAALPLAIGTQQADEPAPSSAGGLVRAEAKAGLDPSRHAETGGNGKGTGGGVGLSEGTFTVRGMSCASCTSNVEKELMRVRGVAAVNVALLTEKAVVQYDSSELAAQSIVEVINSLGYPSEHLRTVFPENSPRLGGEGGRGEGQVIMVEVSGMSCTSCSSKV